MAAKHEITLDRYTRCLLTAIAILLTVVAVELWMGCPSMVESAVAQVPDSGLQRKVLNEKVRKTNRLLEQILQHLQTKPVKVEVLDPDKRDSGLPSRTTRKP